MSASLALLLLVCVTSEFAVRPEIIYQVQVRTGSTTNRQAVAFMTELNRAGQTNIDHRLAFTTGYLPLPPNGGEFISYFATTPAAKRVQFGMTAPCEVESITIRPFGRVVYPRESSANFVRNGHCERANEQGVAADFGRWSGPPDAKLVAGAGRDGSAAIAITNYYILGCGEITTVPGRYYRFRAWCKGPGQASMEMRPATKGFEALFMARNYLPVTLTGQDWQLVTMDAVALPGEDRFHAVLVLQPAAGQTIYVDDIEVVEVGQSTRQQR